MTMTDYTRNTKVYLKRKDEVPEKIQEFVQMAETRFGRPPAIIRSDSGGEYKSKKLGRYYRSKGITPQYTAAYSPQQNGMAERNNRTLVEMARCMLIEAKMDVLYWAEAINTVAYIQN